MIPSLIIFLLTITTLIDVRLGSSEALHSVKRNYLFI